MTRHGSLYPLPLPLAVQVVRLTGDVAVARHVAVPVVLHVAADLLVQGGEGGDIWVGLGVDNSDLEQVLHSCGL